MTIEYVHNSCGFRYLKALLKELEEFAFRGVPDLREPAEDSREVISPVSRAMITMLNKHVRLVNSSQRLSERSKIYPTKP